MRILLAEDDTKLGKHVQQALMAEGYAVDWATEGEEALWLAENYPFDVMILDIMMPQRDGINIVRTLRRKGITSPVLFMTARREVAVVPGPAAGIDVTSGAGRGDGSPVTLSITTLDILFISLTAIGISFIATLYPSWQAARQDPVEVLRYE